MPAHGLMLHHFHNDGNHIRSQGSISSDEFDRMLSLYAKNHTLLSAKEWLRKSARGELQEHDVCITFDDALRCQFDLALPVLTSRNLTAFFFITTEHLNGTVPKLELYRYFRFKYFGDILDFYRAFDEASADSPFTQKIAEGLKTYDPATFYREYAMYTPEDKRFRYIRDRILVREEYETIMDLMLQARGVEKEKLLPLLWMNSECLVTLAEQGHLLGLHSHTHPTNMKMLPKERQQSEYRTNKDILEKIAGKPITAMSHPEGSYNADTLAVLKELGIEVGFLAHMESPENPGTLEYPRYNHCYLIPQIRE